MKIVRWLIATFVAVGLFFLLSISIASAQTIKTGATTTVAANQTINSSLFATGNTIDIAGTVNGDVYCAGQTVTISGTVKGDVICAGQTLSVSGTVDGNVRAAAQTLTISGSVGKNISVAGQTVTHESKAKTGGDAFIAGATVVLNGVIGRDAGLSAGTIDIGATIGRNVRANVTKLTLTSTAKIAGNLTYTSATQVAKDQGAVVSGTTARHEPTKKQSNGASFAKGLLLFAVIAGLGMLLAAIVLAALIPRIFFATSYMALHHFWTVVLSGLIAAIVVPAVILLLMISVIGIPLALMALLIWLLMCLLSGIFTAFYIGRLVWRTQHNAVLIMLVGGVLLLILYFIPIIGILAMLVAFLLGIGMEISLLQRTYRRFRFEPVAVNAELNGKKEAPIKKRA